MCDGTFRLWDRGVWEKNTSRANYDTPDRAGLANGSHAGQPLRVLHTVPPLGWQSHMGLPNEIGNHCYQEEGSTCV